MSSMNQVDILQWIGKSSGRLFIKKLSQNDCVWADGQEFGHQNGVYILREIREADFFPHLSSSNPLKPWIFDAKLSTCWPATGECKESSLKHYSNKGTEMHFTGVPKACFAGLTPASLLIGARCIDEAEGMRYWFMVIDSATEEAEFLESLFDLNADFHFGLFAAQQALALRQDETESLIAELSKSLREGTLAAFIRSVSQLPGPEVFAQRAQDDYMRQHGLTNLDPYKMDNPGDAIMQISRDIEYRLYKQAELRHRAADVVRIIAGGGADIVTAIVRGFPELDATFLSASQRRKSRAGLSFEQHIGRLLTDGRIAFEEQVVTGGRRPDFVLPSLAVLTDLARDADGAIILSAKTTLRERWKQVAMENHHCAFFLATVDDRVPSLAIDDMRNQQICLVVPESLKNAKETCYGKKDNVITFRSFFDDQIAGKRSHFRGGM
jgi:hypothetical protein